MIKSWIFLRHAVAINEENPLVHLEIFYVQRRKQLDQLDSFNCEISFFFAYGSTFLFDLEDADELVEKMWPQFPQCFSQCLEIESDKKNSGQEEQEKSLLDIFFLLLLEDFNHLFHQLIQQVLEIVFFTRENQESNSLHRIAFMVNDFL